MLNNQDQLYVFSCCCTGSHERLYPVTIIESIRNDMYLISSLHENDREVNKTDLFTKKDVYKMGYESCNCTNGSF